MTSRKLVLASYALGVGVATTTLLGHAHAQEAVEGKGMEVSPGTVIHPNVGAEFGVIDNLFYEQDSVVTTALMRLTANFELASEKITPDEVVPDDDGTGSGQAAAAPPRPLKSVYAVHAALLEQPALAGLSIGVLHGRLSAEDKDAIMLRFQQGDLDVLVSTTVIEVGVDVANASVMVVMDADRFGVSQLHQLRGRIGRGGHPGLCLLVTGTDAEPAMTRLSAVAATTDGFELARLDLSQRREGDILGAAQHGRRTQLEFLHILDDEDVIVDAREDAFALVAADPDLTDHPELAEAVRARVDAEQAAYLERG